MKSLIKLKEKLKARERVFMPVLSPRGTFAAGAFARAGVDCMLIDTEHSPVGMETLFETLTACRKTGLPSIVRVPYAAYPYISKTLDAGADGIMVPRVETLEQVKTAVSSSKFPPVGIKGCGGPGIFYPGETTAQFNNNRVLFLQIESPAGIDTLPEMLSLFSEHIDGVVIGPTDLSISLGIPMKFDDPLLHSEIRRLIRICREHEKSCGMWLCDLTTAGFWAREGMNILWTSGDSEFAAVGAAELVRRVGSLNSDG